VRLHGSGRKRVFRPLSARLPYPLPADHPVRQQLDLCFLSLQALIMDSVSRTPISRHSASSLMPPFPGAQYILSTLLLRESFHTIACSRPPSLPQVLSWHSSVTILVKRRKTAGVNQCLKCRIPVNTMAIPYLSHASIDSWSLPNRRAE